MDNSKICSKCKQEKSLSEFTRNRTHKDGRNHYCKVCANDLGKKIYFQQRKEYAIKHAKYRLSHLEEETKNRRLREDKLRLMGLCIACGVKPAEHDIQHCRECADKSNKRRIIKSFSLRTKALNTYGGKCSCCGETNPDFLTLDHINDDGSKHRKEVGVGMQLYRWLEKNNYPDTFQVLCWNCNCGKRMNKGICPHKRLILLTGTDSCEY